MPNKWNTPLEQYWAGMVRKYVMDPCASYIQIRKMHVDIHEIIPAEIFNTGISMGYSDMGYGNDTSKGSQLRRNYFNEEELVAARDQFKERLSSSGKKNAQSCISARMGNVKKGKGSQGFCMQTITINYLKDHCGKETLYIDMSYRTTELLQKFLADLKYLHEEVIPFILEGVDIPLTGVRLNFSTVYVSLMFFPIWYRNEDMLEIMETLHEVDYKFWRLVVRAAQKLLDPVNTYNYQTRAKQHDFFRNQCIPNMPIRKINKTIKYVDRGVKDL